MPHFESIVIDAHDDTTQRFLDPAYDLGQRHPNGSVDIPRARAGGLDAIFFSVYIPGTITGTAAVERARAQVAAIHRQVERNPRDLALVTSAAGVREAVGAGRIAALIGIEGGHMIGNDLGVLRELFDGGARYMTLTHNVNIEWADSSGDEPLHGGLSDFGREVVREMNRLGMIVDISHVSDETFADVIETSRAPVFASHSSARALCDHPRNLSDDMIRVLAGKGGVVQVNFHTAFLSQAFIDAFLADDGKIAREFDAEAAKRCGEDEACQVDVLNALVRDAVDAGRLPRVEWTAIVEHIDHIARLVGVDHVGLGSDFDGAFMPYGMEDASGLPRITTALLERGYSADDLRKILGGNTLRLMEAVQGAAGP